MNALVILYFYTFVCSTLMVYGIGLEKSFFESRPDQFLFRRLPFLIITVLVSIIVLRFVMISLVKNHYYLIPPAIIFITSCIQLVTKIIFNNLEAASPGERILIYGTIFLALFESITLVDSILLALACFLSFIIWTLLLSTIRERLDNSRLNASWNGTPLILINMGLLSLLIHSIDTSWWLQDILL